MCILPALKCSWGSIGSALPTTLIGRLTVTLVSLSSSTLTCSQRSFSAAASMPAPLSGQSDQGDGNDCLLHLLTS